MRDNLHDYRKSYNRGALTKDKVDTNPLQQFKKWFYEAKESGSVEEVNAMTLSTTGLDGFSKGRVVLLKKYDKYGFYFYTNYWIVVFIFKFITEKIIKNKISTFF